MAINHPTDKSALKSLFTEMKSKEMTDDECADKFATIIENIALSMTVTVAGVQSGGSTIIGTNT